MSVTKNKDILSLLQSRTTLRANFLTVCRPSVSHTWPAVDDQKADKKAMKEIVQLRRAQKALCKALSNYSKNTRVQLAHGV